jgi:hypothetical protein
MGRWDRKSPVGSQFLSQGWRKARFPLLEQGGEAIHQELCHGVKKKKASAGLCHQSMNEGEISQLLILPTSLLLGLHWLNLPNKGPRGCDQSRMSVESQQNHKHRRVLSWHRVQHPLSKGWGLAAGMGADINLLGPPNVTGVTRSEIHATHQCDQQLWF